MKSSTNCLVAVRPGLQGDPQGHEYKVALKVLPPGSLISPRARHQFEREVELISSLDHPYVVRIRDSGISAGQYYFAMEYIRGEALDKHVSTKHLPLRQILELFVKVCEAVAHAHQRGVIHRDLKPPTSSWMTEAIPTSWTLAWQKRREDLDPALP